MNFRKNLKRVFAAALVGVMALTGSAFAGTTASPDPNTKVTPVTATKVITDITKSTADTNADGTATLVKANNVKKSAYYGTLTSNNVKYTVTKIAANALKGNTKVESVTLVYSGKKMTVSRKAFNGSSVTKLRLTKYTKASQLTFKKGAFKGSSIKTIVVGKAMSKYQYRKLVKALKAAGYTGVVKRKA